MLAVAWYTTKSADEKFACSTVGEAGLINIIAKSQESKIMKDRHYEQNDMKHNVTASKFCRVSLSSELHDVHDDVMKWEGFPRYLAFVRESTSHRWIPSTKVSDVEL